MIHSVRGRSAVNALQPSGWPGLARVAVWRRLLPRIPTAYDVVDCTGVLNPQPSSHARDSNTPRRRTQRKTL